MVREAFSLLRQSIIHVEKDDIDFDDDDQEAALGMDVDDAQRDAEDIAAAAEAEASASSLNPSSTDPATSTSIAPSPSSAPAAIPAARKKLKITYDRYMSIMNLVVIHLSEAERTDEPTVEREELIEWYLEQREAELQTVQDLEDERELIGKALNKLVKDQYLLEIRGVTQDELAVEGGEDEQAAKGEERVSYIVHPQVDLTDLSSSLS